MIPPLTSYLPKERVQENTKNCNRGCCVEQRCFGQVGVGVENVPVEVHRSVTTETLG